MESCEAEPVAGTVSVCLVDDDEIMRDLLSRNFKRAGCTVMLAESPAKATEILEAEDIDIVISDYRMPTEAEGIAFLSHVNQHFPTLPVVMMSSELGDETEQVLKNAGAFDCLAKPFDTSRIANILQRLSEAG